MEQNTPQDIAAWREFLGMVEQEILGHPEAELLGRPE
jgi:hypothetical protein